MRSFTGGAAAFTAAAISAFLLTGCPDPSPYCGDGSCDVGERSWCRSDCGAPPDDPDPGPGPGPGPTSCGDRPPSPTGVQLPTGNVQQWCSQWCWAAVITNVAHFYGLQASECTLASYYVGDPSLSVCCQYAACSYSQCNHPATDQDMSRLLLAVGLTGRFERRPLTEFELRTELTNGRPVVGLFHDGATIGHFAAITGYVGGAPAIYTVDDPWPYNGVASTRFFLTYDQVLGGPMGQSPWRMSWFRISTRADGCNPRWDPSCGCDDPPDTDPPDPEPETCTGDFPVDCGDGTGCWNEGTDCANTVFECNGQWRCGDGADAASCCGGNFITCPASHPFPCPSESLCYDGPNPCTTSSCEWAGAACQ